MLKSSSAVEIQAAKSAVSVDGFSVKHVEVDVQRKNVIVRGTLMSGNTSVRSKSLELRVGDAAIATLVTQVENGLKKKFADEIGFDDAKTTVE